MKWFIPGNVPSSKNSRRWTGKFFIASKTTMKYRKQSESYYKQHAKTFAKEFAKYELPVYVSFKFMISSFPNHKGFSVYILINYKFIHLFVHNVV